MALITCPECGGKLSNLAQVCVHCGLPNPGSSSTASNTPLAPNNYDPAEESHYRQITSVDDFEDVQISRDRNHGMAIDIMTGRFAIMEKKIWREINPSKIIEIQAEESDGVTELRSKKAAMVGAAVVGGLLTGGFGAVVGAMLPGKKAVTKNAYSRLRILTSDPRIPVIVFSDNDFYRPSQWRDKLTALKHSSDQSRAARLQSRSSAEQAIRGEIYTHQAIEIQPSNVAESPINARVHFTTQTNEDTPEIRALKQRLDEVKKRAAVFSEIIRDYEKNTEKYNEVNEKLTWALSEIDNLRYKIDPDAAAAEDRPR